MVYDLHFIDCRCVPLGELTVLVDRHFHGLVCRSIKTQFVCMIRKQNSVDLDSRAVNTEQSGFNGAGAVLHFFFKHI